MLSVQRLKRFRRSFLLKALQGTKLIVETADKTSAREFIAQNGQYAMHYVGQDPEKFALYEIDVDKSLKDQSQ